MDETIREIKERWRRSPGGGTTGLTPSEQMQAFKRTKATEARILARSCESLLGMCAGVVADGVLNDEEIRFLDLWLNENGDLAYTWPGEVLYSRIREALRDGHIEEEERAYLRETITQIVGGAVGETGAVFGKASTLAVDGATTVEISNKSFCFTGTFLFGTRAACERAVTARGGVVGDNVTIGLDYLVIGTMTSENWAHTTWGRKIEKAVEYRNRGYKLRIVAEDQWVRALG